MPKELKRKVLSEEKKGSILALLAEGYSEHHVASIIKISKTAVHKDMVKQQTLGRTSYRLAEGDNDFPLTGMTANSFKSSLNNRRMTSSDPQKEWQTAAWVKCTARTVRNRLLWVGLLLNNKLLIF